MDVSLREKIGEGGFGDIWKAEDAIGRTVAVKFIRPSAAELSTALDHARVLGRLDHPSIVDVYSVESLTDPDSGELRDAVVMEFLHGETLATRLRKARFTQAEVLEIGTKLLDGLEHIHLQGIAHGDLHGDNVMLQGSQPKIIDVLYRDSLALLSNATKDTRLRKDIVGVRLMLYDILLTSELDPADAAEFNSSLSHQPTLVELRETFLVVADASRRNNNALRIEQSIQRIKDEAFVESEAYASALAAETPQHITPDLLERLIEEGGVTKKHRQYLGLLWDRLSTTERRRICTVLGTAINREVPKGSWGSPIQILASFGKEGWDGLAPVASLRLERAITNDILAGHFDIYGSNIGNQGALGTFSQIFWPNFSDLEPLVDNIVARLKSGWYGQNYVGQYLLWLLPHLGRTTARRKKLVEAVAYAIRNDARVIKGKIALLPPDWQDEITAHNKPPASAEQSSLEDDDIPF